MVMKKKMPHHCAQADQCIDDIIVLGTGGVGLGTCRFMQQALGQVQMEITPLICERVAFACDRGTRKSALQAKFPELDLSALTAEEWWCVAGNHWRLRVPVHVWASFSLSLFRSLALFLSSSPARALSLFLSFSLPVCLFCL